MLSLLFFDLVGFEVEVAVAFEVAGARGAEGGESKRKDGVRRVLGDEERGLGEAMSFGAEGGEISVVVVGRSILREEKEEKPEDKRRKPAAALVKLSKMNYRKTLL